VPEWGGGLLQDTVSPLGDMVHYLAKASFLQDMLLGMFYWVFFSFGIILNKKWAFHREVFNLHKN
jgi:hypothetical protein